MKVWQLACSLAVVALAGGVVGGLVAAHAGSEDRKPKATSAREAKGDAGTELDQAASDGEEESTEVEALRGRIASLERRISLLTAALARGQEVPAGEEDAAGQSPREADVADPVFEAAVLDIMDRERERADGEREARRTELRTQRTQRLSESLTTALDLDEQQKVRVGELIASHFEAMRALRSEDNPERPVTPRQWREKAAELEQALTQGLSGLLSAKQMAAYEALEPEDQISFGFGRPRGRAAPRADGSAPDATPTPPR